MCTGFHLFNPSYRFDSSFVKRLKRYSEGEVYKDSTAVSSGDSQLPQLRHLLADEAKELDR